MPSYTPIDYNPRQLTIVEEKKEEKINTDMPKPPEQEQPDLPKKEKESQTVESTKSEIGWGHQIRSYVLHPYRMVKDNRTNVESSNPDKILDGEIDDFLESSLYSVK